MGLIDKILSIVYPNRCPFCGRVIDYYSNICEECIDNLPIVKEPTCEYCGCNLLDCTCNKKRRVYKTVISPFYYEGPVRECVHRMKFKDRPYISKHMAKEMSQCINKKISENNINIVTCVPMLNKEFKIRGYNQSELIANYLEINGNPKIETKLLKKIYSTPKQHTLSEAQRQGNVLGVFDVNNKIDIKDKIILLVDDVKTTGATANECANVLLDAGAKEVILTCFAITRWQK